MRVYLVRRELVQPVWQCTLLQTGTLQTLPAEIGEVFEVVEMEEREREGEGLTYFNHLLSVLGGVHGWLCQQNLQRNVRISQR